MVPLLPHLLREFHLSEGMAGWISSAFWIGGIVGTLPPLLLIERTGPRRMAVSALGTIAVSMLAFGLADSAVTVMAARFLGGVGATTAWAAAYTWLVLGTPASERGAALATVFTASYVGLLVGPVLGAAAAEVSRELVCTVLAAMLLPLAFWGHRLPLTAEATGRARQSWRGLGTPHVLSGLMLMTLVGTAGGAILVVAPLRLADVGASATAIAAVLWAAYIPRIAFSRASGRILDRRGPALVILCSMATALAFMPLLVAGNVVWVLALAVSAVVLATGVAMVPSMVVVGSGAEQVGLHVGPAFAVAGGVWGVGAVVGAGVAGAAAQHLGDIGGAASVAAPCVLSLLLIARDRSSGRTRTF
jgi:MFS transporter, DHA1 family, inner membrane transport protein